MTKISIVISAGQLGADLGALEAARECGIETGGCAKVGTKTPEFLETYDMIDAPKYDECDRLNARLIGYANGLIVAFLLTRPMTGGGSQKTISYAQCGEYVLFDNCCTDSLLSGPHQVCLFYDPAPSTVEKMGASLRSMIDAMPASSTRMLVTGTCESTCPGTQDAVKAIMRIALA